MRSLSYVSTLDISRKVVCAVLDEKKRRGDDVLLTVANTNVSLLPGVGKTRGFTPRSRRTLHLNQRTGEVWYFKPQAKRIGFGPVDHKVRVGVQGELS